MFDIFSRCGFAFMLSLSLARSLSPAPTPFSIVEIAHVYKALDIGHSSCLSHRPSVVAVLFIVTIWNSLRNELLNANRKEMI